AVAAVGPPRAVLVARGVVPTAGVPGPVDALGRQPVTDGRAGLRRQLRGRLGRVGVREVRLDGRLDGVHRVVAAQRAGRRRADLRVGLAGAVGVPRLGERTGVHAGSL